MFGSRLVIAPARGLGIIAITSAMSAMHAMPAVAHMHRDHRDGEQHPDPVFRKPIHRLILANESRCFSRSNRPLPCRLEPRCRLRRCSLRAARRTSVARLRSATRPRGVRLASPITGGLRSCNRRTGPPQLRFLRDSRRARGRQVKAAGFSLAARLTSVCSMPHIAHGLREERLPCSHDQFRPSRRKFVAACQIARLAVGRGTRGHVLFRMLQVGLLSSIASRPMSPATSVPAVRKLRAFICGCLLVRFGICSRSHRTCWRFACVRNTRVVPLMNSLISPSTHRAIGAAAPSRQRTVSDSRVSRRSSECPR